MSEAFAIEGGRPPVRVATADDIPHIVTLGRRFHAYSHWAHLPYDEAAVAELFGRMIEAEDGVIFLSEDGVCGGLINTLYFSPQTRLAVELFWFAPSGGTDLRQAFEAWARDRGAEAVQFSALGDGRRAATERLYRMAGYQVIETAYLKAF
jgi:hypothetical protein